MTLHASLNKAQVLLVGQQTTHDERNLGVEAFHKLARHATDLDANVASTLKSNELGSQGRIVHSKLLAVESFLLVGLILEVVKVARFVFVVIVLTNRCVVIVLLAVITVLVAFGFEIFKVAI